MTDARVSIDRSRVVGPVSPDVYGHFTEHLVTVIYDGLWSELLYGRKFESPMVGRRDHRMADPWEPFDGRTDDVTYFRGDGGTPRHSSPHADAHHAQSVDVATANTGGEFGITQRPVPIIQGSSYTFRGRVRRRGLSGPMHVALRSAAGTVLAWADIDVPEKPGTRFGDFASAIETLYWMDDTNWTEVSCTLTASGTDLEAALTLTVDAVAGQRVTLWFDWVSLMPVDNRDGWHGAVVDALAAMPTRMLKWPGGCMADAYDWREGVGPRDSRHCYMDQAWLGWDENDVGTDEFLGLCDQLGATPLLGVNAGNGSPESAAAWVEYCNGPASSFWGAQRAANGHPEPYGVQTWVVGNEQWGHFERGYAGPSGYAKRYLRFAEAMRAVDPTITLVAVGKAGEFNRAMLPTAGAKLDQLQIHHYSPEVPVVDDASATAKIRTAESFDAVFSQITDDLASVGGCEHVRITVDEWGWSRGNHAGTIYTAAALNAMHRWAWLVASAARTCVTNADGVVNRVGDVIEIGNTYEVFRLYDQAWRPTAVSVTTDVADASCLVDDDGGVSVFIVNPEASVVRVTIDGTGLADGAAVVVDQVVAGDGGAVGPTSVSTTDKSTWGTTWDLPPHSLTIIRT